VKDIATGDVIQQAYFQPAGDLLAELENNILASSK
jgi:hypothetical protein